MGGRRQAAHLDRQRRAAGRVHDQPLLGARAVRVRPWGTTGIRGWAALLGMLATWPGILAVSLRLLVEARHADDDGARFAPRCPVSCTRLRLP